MTHSNLTSFCMHSPNGYFPRAYPITKVTIHHMAGVLSAEQCGNVFSTPARQASSNYGIGNDGEIACYVEEENAAWTSSNWDNDNRAITMEVSDSYYGKPWPISDAAWDSMIALCADICNRYGIEPYYDGTPNGTFTEHMMFAPTGCPGTYIHERMYQIVEEVKAAMEGKPKPKEEEIEMAEALIYIDNDHEGYKKGDIIYWSPAAGFCYLEHPACVDLIKECSPDIKEIHSAKTAPWIVRAKQATNPIVAAKTYGKRN